MFALNENQKDAFTLIVETEKKIAITELDDIASVELIDMTPRIIPKNENGCDYRITDVARISYTGNKPVSDNVTLLNFLYRHEHMTPFEFVDFTFYIKCPDFIMMQWLRHRIASVNQRSRRYSEFDEEFYMPKELKNQSSKNKQGSSDLKNKDSEEFLKLLEDNFEKNYDLYKKMIDNGVAKEQARVVLPCASYTEFCWKINLRGLLNFLRLRTDPSAQKEIQLYAKAIYKIVNQLVPNTIKAFEECDLKSLKFHSYEIPLLKQIIDQKINKKNKIINYGINDNFVQPNNESNNDDDNDNKNDNVNNNNKEPNETSLNKRKLTKREMDEFKEKLNAIGLCWIEHE